MRRSGRAIERLHHVGRQDLPRAAARASRRSTTPSSTGCVGAVPLYALISFEVDMLFFFSEL